MTSGVHAGHWAHEILHLLWTNLNDILPIYCCQTFFYMMFQRAAFEERVQANEAKKTS